MKVKQFLIVILFTFCASYYCNAQKSIDIKGKYSATININKIVGKKTPVKLSAEEIKKQNIDLKKVENMLGSEYSNQVVKNAAKHIDEGLLELKGGRLKLTKKGIYISDMIMSDIMIV